MAIHNEIGTAGENAAKAYLLKQGYAVLHTNWRYRRYELDIVATKENELVIVEVKTRSEDYQQSPIDAIDYAKIKRTVSAADVYVRQFDVDLPVRFDVISVTKTTLGYEIEHIDNAFYSPIW